jgi:hypothetical protein
MGNKDKIGFLTYLEIYASTGFGNDLIIRKVMLGVYREECKQESRIPASNYMRSCFDDQKIKE